MTDDLRRKKPEDPNKVNINQDWELEYWSKKFGITIYQLKKIVEKVGPMVNDIIKELKKCPLKDSNLEPSD